MPGKAVVSLTTGLEDPEKVMVALGGGAGAPASVKTVSNGTGAELSSPRVQVTALGRPEAK